MIKEIQAKTLLSTVRSPQSWFGVNYNMNIYRGCEHKCIYCDSRSECYQIENFDDILVKTNAVELLSKELSAKRKKGIIGTGAMSDPYTYVERDYQLTRQALKTIAYYGYGIHIVTKSGMVARDVDMLKLISSRCSASVALTITTCNDALAEKVEPGAPLPTKRFEAMKALSSEGIYVGVCMMPILPFIEDNEENIYEIIEKTDKNGGRFIIPAFGMTIRTGQREYFYRQLDEHFPGLKQKYHAVYRDQYSCSSENSDKLYKRFKDECSRRGIIYSMKQLPMMEQYEQLSLF